MTAASLSEAREGDRGLGLRLGMGLTSLVEALDRGDAVCVMSPLSGKATQPATPPAALRERPPRLATCPGRGRWSARPGTVHWVGGRSPGAAEAAVFPRLRGR